MKPWVLIVLIVGFNTALHGNKTKASKDSRYGAMYMFNKDASDKVSMVKDTMAFVITTAHNLLITAFE